MINFPIYSFIIIIIIIYYFYNSKKFYYEYNTARLRKKPLEKFVLETFYKNVICNLQKAIKSDKNLFLDTTRGPSNYTGPLMILSILTFKPITYSLNINNIYYTCNSKQEVLDTFLCYIDKDNDTTDKRQSCINLKRIMNNKIPEK